MTRDTSSPSSGDPRRDRWKAHRAARREELLQAVVDAVRQHGPGIGMEDVSSLSGIAKPVFYRYFTDKSDLYRAVGRLVAERIAGTVMAAVDAQAEPRAMVAAGIDAFLRTIEQEPDLYRFVLHPPSGAAGDPVADYSTVVGLHVSRVLGDRVRSAGLDSGVAEPWGFAMVGAVRAASERWLEQPALSRDALGRYLTDLLWSGAAGAYAAAGVAVPRLQAVADEQRRPRAHEAGNESDPPAEAGGSRSSGQL